MHESYTLSGLISQYKKSEKPPSNEERENEKSATDVMSQIEQILPELEDGDLKKLLDPCVVLVLAGYKPTTFLYKGPLQTSSEKYNKHNIDISHRTPISLIAARNRLRESKLIQIICKNTKIEPPMSPEQYDELEDVIAIEVERLLGGHKNIAHNIFQGIILGYPDQAILDNAMADYKDHIHGVSFDHRNRMVPAGITEGNETLEYISKHYPVPDFDVFPEHANDPSVVSASTRQREFLEEFYLLPQVVAMLESVGIRKE